MTETIIVSPKEMNDTFTSILLANGFQLEKAKACAEVFTSNSIDGVYSHGVNRFARFIEYIQNWIPHFSKVPVAFLHQISWVGREGIEISPN